MAADDESFRFIVHIMPPRQPANSLFRTAADDEPVRKLAVPARPSETFEDVWNNITSRYVRSYGPEIVAKGWFHKLQDRTGCDINTQDGVGQLGYNHKTPIEDLELHMLQNFHDSEGSLPDHSALRPSGFRGKRQWDAEEEDGGGDDGQRQAKRVKYRDEMAGKSSQEPQGYESEASQYSQTAAGTDDEDGEAQPRIDADGFTVPALPKLHRKKKKKGRQGTDNTRIPSSMEGEDDASVLVEDSQRWRFEDAPAVPEDQEYHPAPADIDAPRGHDHRSGRRAGIHSRSAAPTSLQAPQEPSPESFGLEPRLESTDAKTTATKEKRKSPPTPDSSDVLHQPPESAQRPKPTVTQTPASTGRLKKPSSKPTKSSKLNFQVSAADEDPIEDDVLLQGIGPMSNDELSDAQGTPRLDQPQNADKSGLRKGSSHKSQPALHQTPKPPVGKTQSSPQGSGSKNPRSQQDRKNVWTAAEDAFLTTGIRLGYEAAEIKKRFDLSNRTTSAIRGRRRLLQAKDPNLRNETLVEDGDEGNTAELSSQRKMWSSKEVQVIFRAISDGYDAREIHARDFPNRSEDSVNRKCLALQDNAWKLAEKQELFPRDFVQLTGWTTKDSCKLKRAFFENLPAEEMKRRFFGRFSTVDIKKKVEAYRAQIKELERRPSSLSKAMPSSANRGNVNSSPLERTTQSRAERGDPHLHMHGSSQGLQLSSSPPGPPTSSLPSSQPRRLNTQTGSMLRTASPAVHILASEQDAARSEVASGSRTLNKAPAGSGGQTTLNFTREKGKKRAGPPEPSIAECTALYPRRHRQASARPDPVSRHEDQGSAESEEGQEMAADAPEEDDEFDEHTPADDLNMIEAEYSLQQSRENSALGDAPDFHSADGSDAQQPDHPVPRTVELSMTPKASKQSPKATKKSHKASNQTLETFEPTLKAYEPSQKTSRTLKSLPITPAIDATLTEAAKPVGDSPADDSNDEETQPTPLGANVKPSRTAEDLANAKPTLQPGPEASRVSTEHLSGQPASTPKSSKGDKRASAQLSGELHSSVPGGSPSGQSGKLPPRGQSYASRIRNVQGPATPSVCSPPKRSPAAAAREPIEPIEPNEPKPAEFDPNGPVPRDQRSPTPTDASIWAEVKVPATVRMTRREYFDNLKDTTLRMHYIRYRDYTEIARMNAGDRRKRREQRTASKQYLNTGLEIEHPDGPAQGGDQESADEDVIRIDDGSVLGFSGEEEFYDDDDGYGAPPSDASSSDFQEPMELDRHFSEVEDEEDGPVAMDQTRQCGAGAMPFDDPDADVVEELELPSVPTLLEENHDAPAPTDEALQKLANSGAEDTPLSDKRKTHMVETTEPDTASQKRTKRTSGKDTSASRKSKAHAVETTEPNEESPKRAKRATANAAVAAQGVETTEPPTVSRKRKKRASADDSTMPPPSTTKAQKSPNAKRSKRHARRIRHAERIARSGSERSSSVAGSNLAVNSDRPEVSSPMPIKQPSSETKTRAGKTNQAPAAISSAQQSSQCDPVSTQPAGSQPQAGGLFSSQGISSGMRNIMKRWHVPSPPRTRSTAPTTAPAFALNQSDDESEVESIR